MLRSYTADDEVPANLGGTDAVRWLRRRVFDRHVNIAQAEGLEFGPEQQPLIRPNEGKIKYADYLTKADHIAAGANPDLVHETDIIITHNDYVSQIPNKFDYVVANHVMEHAPNMIGFLRQISQLLKPGGFAFLALPDKKFTFDKYRPNTSLSHIIADSYKDEQNISAEHLLEVGLYSEHGGKLNPGQQLNRDFLDSFYKREPFNGFHCHVFQSETIIDTILVPIFALGYVDMRVADFRPGAKRFGGEMLIVLKNEKSDSAIDPEAFYDIRLSTV